MDQDHGFDRSRARQFLFQRLDGNRRSPGRFDANRDAAASFDHGRQPGAEHAVDSHDRTIAGLDKIGNHRFHACRSGSGQGNRKLIFCVERGTEQGLNLVHQSEKNRVEVAEQRLTKGLQHPGMDHARARAHEQAMRRNKVLIPGGCSHRRCRLSLLVPGGITL
jgi:hypothetical protein